MNPSDLRPLDRLRSIKTKLGVLVGATVLVAAAVTTATARLGWSAWWTVPLAVLLALGLTQLLAHGMTAPLRQMTSIAASMAAGQYGRRAPVSSRDEVGDLGRAFNTMAAELEQVDEQRRALVADVSHELRTPITALHALLENLVDGVDEADPEALRTALGQTERLGRLVADLVDLSRVEAGQVTLDPAPVPLAELLEDAVAVAAVGHPELRFELEVDPTDLVVEVDRHRLQQVLTNLLDNAVRHSPPAGAIRLCASGGQGAPTVIDVIDDGPGIPAVQRQQVFERFHTDGPPDQRRTSHGGTGLGLAIARWVVQLHGGTIAVVDSTRGCDVRVQLPAPD